jgi:hypothetical protein
MEPRPLPEPDPENARSRRVAEAAGFELEGILRRDIRHEGALRDTAVCAHPLSGERLVDLLEREHSHRPKAPIGRRPVTRWAASSPPFAAAP